MLSYYLNLNYNQIFVIKSPLDTYFIEEVIKNFRTIKGTVEKLCFFYSPFVYGENYGE